MLGEEVRRSTALSLSPTDAHARSEMIIGSTSLGKAKNKSADVGSDKVASLAHIKPEGESAAQQSLFG